MLDSFLFLFIFKHALTNRRRSTLLQRNFFFRTFLLSLTDTPRNNLVSWCVRKHLVNSCCLHLLHSAALYICLDGYISILRDVLSARNFQIPLKKMKFEVTTRSTSFCTGASKKRLLKVIEHRADTSDLTRDIQEILLIMNVRKNCQLEINKKRSSFSQKATVSSQIKFFLFLWYEMRKCWFHSP